MARFPALRSTCAATIALACLALGATGAEAKTFRHYYGMQWEWEATPIPAQPNLASKGEVLFKTRLLPTRLFVLDSDFTVGGKLILPKGEQLSQAESRFLVRCSMGPADRGSMAYDRRICFWDSDGDKKLDAWFDEGMGMEWGKFQFTGCLPLLPQAAQVPGMAEIDPKDTKWPFWGTLTLGGIFSDTDKLTGRTSYGFRLDFEIKRSDKPALKFTVCRNYGSSCLIGNGQQVNLRDFMQFRVTKAEGNNAALELLEPIARKGYFNMTPGNRPDPIYCPGSMFVKTDQNDAW